MKVHGLKVYYNEKSNSMYCRVNAFFADPAQSYRNANGRNQYAHGCYARSLVIFGRILLGSKIPRLPR